MTLLEHIKAVFNRKFFVEMALKHIDKLVPVLATEIDRQKEKLAALNSTEKAQWAVDQAKAYLRKQI